MKMRRWFSVSFCLMGMTLGAAAITAGCDGSSEKPTQVKVDEKQTQEHNDKMMEYMQGKGAKKPGAK